jgi:DNA-binding transcriptional MerR regulator/SAM-dependent methyltransferase
MKRYRITELGRRFGLSRSTLLYYDRIGLLRPSDRSGADYRLYGEEDVERLERICLFRGSGLRLSEIARLLKGADRRSVLEGRLREIGREIAELRTRQRHLAGMLRTASAAEATSGLDRKLWLGLRKACGLSEEALRRWHDAFERQAAQAHHAFLLSLGLSEKEALQVRMLTRNVEGNETTMKYFYEVFEDLPRQGPGCTDLTLKALSLVKGLPPRPEVLDIGCGCGAQTLVVARKLRSPVTAVDNHGPVLERLSKAARAEGLDIRTRELSMLELPFPPASFDLLWAEGSIFIIGMQKGLRTFRELVRPGGTLVFSEMCWFDDNPPREIADYFARIYPDLQKEADVRRLAKEAGWSLVGDFRFPESAWWQDFYDPMLARIQKLRKRDAGTPEALALYAGLELEAEMFRRHAGSYGYCFFVLRSI